jgi:hypothetical protein
MGQRTLTGPTHCGNRITTPINLSTDLDRIHPPPGGFGNFCLTQINVCCDLLPTDRGVFASRIGLNACFFVPNMAAMPMKEGRSISIAAIDLAILDDFDKP